MTGLLRIQVIAETDRDQVAWYTKKYVNRHNRRIRKHSTDVEKHLA